LAFSAKQPAPGGFTVLRRRLAREIPSDARKLRDLNKNSSICRTALMNWSRSTGLVT
jgi:hypothetical protein